MYRIIKLFENCLESNLIKSQNNNNYNQISTRIMKNIFIDKLKLNHNIILQKNSIKYLRLDLYNKFI